MIPWFWHNIDNEMALDDRDEKKVPGFPRKNCVCVCVCVCVSFGVSYYKLNAKWSFPWGSWPLLEPSKPGPGQPDLDRTSVFERKMSVSRVLATHWGRKMG